MNIILYSRINKQINTKNSILEFSLKNKITNTIDISIKTLAKRSPLPRHILILLVYPYNTPENPKALV